MKNTALSLLITLAILNDAQGQCNAPTNLQASYSNNITTFSWSSINGASGYVVELKQSSGTWVHPAKIDTTANNTYAYTGLMQSLYVDWRVKTLCSNSESVYNYSNFTIPCPQPENLANTSIAMTGATINWAPAPGYNTYVSDFSLAYRPSNSSWISLGNTSGISKTISNLKANTTYEWRVVQTCIFSNSTSATSAFITPACNSTGINTAEWISVFKLGNINRSSGAEAGGYTSTNIATNLTAGSNNSARIRVGQNGVFTSKLFKVYIDYNNNNIYEETEIVHGPTSINNTGNISFTFSLPSNAVTGLHSMRVIMARSGTNITGCMNGFNGETEDYIVNIVNIGNKSTQIPVFTAKEQEKLVISPNPIANMLNIQTPAGVSTINVYDMIGKRIYQQQVLNSEIQINTTQWPASQYVVEAIYADGHKDTTRVIKQ